MRPNLHPRLVNGRFGDPALFVEMLHRRGAILFDLTRVRRAEPEWFSPAYWDEKARPVESGGRGDEPAPRRFDRHVIRGRFRLVFCESFRLVGRVGALAARGRAGAGRRGRGCAP